jgi:hypothetical protein
MKQLLLNVFLFGMFPFVGIAQNTDSTYTSTLSNPRPVAVVTKDARTYKGMVIDITTDYIVLDLHSNKSLMVNTPYYVRPMGKYYRIDVEYIQVAYTKKPKRVLKSALFGGLGGMVAFGTASIASGDDNDASDFFIASAVGLVVGSVVGTVTALIVKKKWHINGSSEELAAFRDHYF